MAPAPRPQLHFTARAGWINDPLGLTHADGVYHLFFQHVPGGTVWDVGCHWGHATSTDLLHWVEQPGALAPGDGDDGCWSGSVVLADDGVPVIFYTSVAAPDLALGAVRSARPGADWADWHKGEVLVRPPVDVPAEVFRDPFVLRDGDRWYMLVGAGLAGGTAAVLGWTSPDLRTWEPDGVVAQRSGEAREPWTGTAWECPQLIVVDGRHVLVVSVWHAHELQHVAYAAGSFSGGRFVAQAWRRLTYGPCYYAPTTFVDDQGRPGMVHWLRTIADVDQGWAGALSVPHVLRLDGDRLRAAPHPALDRLRVAGAARQDGVLDVEWSPSSGNGPLRLRRASSDPVAELSVSGDLLTVVTPAGASPGQSWTVPYAGDPVRVLADGPVLEVFAGYEVLSVPLPAGPGAVRPDGDDPALRWWVLVPT